MTILKETRIPKRNCLSKDAILPATAIPVRTRRCFDILMTSF